MSATISVNGYEIKPDESGQWCVFAASGENVAGPFSQQPDAAKNNSNSTYVMVTRMKKVLTLLALVTLGGCATASSTYLADGKQGLSIDCSGEAMSWAKCYEKAEASCAGTGYTIIATDGSPALAQSEKTLGADVGNFKSRTVVVACK